jgi:hypothetical protein
MIPWPSSSWMLVGVTSPMRIASATLCFADAGPRNPFSVEGRRGARARFSFATILDFEDAYRDVIRTCGRTRAGA